MQAARLALRARQYIEGSPGARGHGQDNSQYAQPEDCRDREFFTSFKPNVPQQWNRQEGSAGMYQSIAPTVANTCWGRRESKACLVLSAPVLLTPSL